MGKADILHGNNLELLRNIPDNTVDAIVTDPPYGLKFMGKKWDYEVPTVAQWKECLRVLKPGGYLLSFAGTRTQHRMACNIEDAGFEIRDMIAWVYGSGFPKSLDISKAIDKQKGLERKIIGKRTDGRYASMGTDIRSNNYKNGNNGSIEIGIISEPASIESKEWEGWGTSLKPSLEPITVARKTLSEKTVAENCLKWGTGGINIDECRVECEGGSPSQDRRKYKTPTGDYNGWDCTSRNGYNDEHSGEGIGRFPANLIHDGSDEVLECFPQSNGAAAPVKKGQNGDSKGIYGDFAQKGDDGESFRGDSGSAARFFYCAKASRSERNLGCDDLEESHFQMRPFAEEGCDQSVLTNRMNSKVGKNNHPTVKPIKLMEYLIKLVSREGAIILDPWAGSGTTGIACVKLNRQFILMEQDEHSYDIMKARVTYFIPKVNATAPPKKEIRIGEQMELF